MTLNLLDLMDDVQVHAAAAAAAVNSSWLDVAVGHPMPRSKWCARVFYAGERPVEKMGGQRTLNSQLMGESVICRAFWPMSEYATKRGRTLMGEISSFVVQLRTRLLGDSQLGGDCSDLTVRPAEVDDVLIGGNHYAIVDLEVLAEYSEYAIAP